MLTQKERSRSLLSELSPAQLSAVLETEGSCLVCAGAGAGKTRVLTRRIIHLLNSGVEPGSILAITFTNDAANEMKTRVYDLLDELGMERVPLFIQTFHAWAKRALLEDGLKFEFLDAEQSIALWQQTNGRKHNKERARIDYLKSLGIFNAADYEYRQPEDFDADLARLWQSYDSACASRNAIDFNDQLLIFLKRLKDNKSFREKHQEKLNHILVDEFQDVNIVQYEMIRGVFSAGTPGKSLWVCGDDDQLLYSFRGAMPDIFPKFLKEFNSNRIDLGKNYRNQGEIVRVAKNFIERNKNRLDKVISANRGATHAVEGRMFNTPEQEIAWVTGAVGEATVRGEEVLVLCRDNATADFIKEELGQAELIHAKGNGMWLSGAEVMQITALLRAALDPSDKHNLYQMLAPEMRVFGEMVKDVEETLNLTAWESFLLIPELNSLAKTVAEVSAFLWQGNYSLALSLCIESAGFMKQALAALSTDRTAGKATAILNRLADAVGAAAKLEKAHLEPEEFVERISEDLSVKPSSISILTGHKSKGLERHTVFICGLEKFSPQTAAEEEEERRLIYVALTRGTERVFISGSGNSRYLSELRDSGVIGITDEQCNQPAPALLPKENKSNSKNTYDSTGKTGAKLPGFKLNTRRR